MKSTLIILVTLFFLAINAFSQDSIFWKPDIRLKWQDFAGKVDAEKPYGAVTSTGVAFRFSILGDKFIDTVVAVFYKKNSWVRVFSSEGLDHEQGHFDISEIFARKLRKELLNYKIQPSTLKWDLSLFYYKMESERNEMEDLYDKETDFSRNTKMQKFWDSRIKKELDELRAYEYH